MGKVTKVVAHLSKEEISEKIKGTVGFWKVQKWLVIWNAMVDPRPAEEIALHTGLAKQTVHNLVSSYNRLGAEAVSGPGRGGRKRAYLSLEEEAAFLESFKEKAVTGQVATVLEIHKALENLLGHTVHKTTVYRLLSRQGWRKIAPRPFHVQAKAKEQAEFKKNFLKKQPIS